MKKSIRHIFYILMTAVLFVSCGDKEESLQRYFVDHQETKGFISQDIPLSFLRIDQAQLSDSQKKAYKSVNKLNFLAFKANDNNDVELQTEFEHVKAILSNPKYNDLIELSDRGNKISVKYVGEDDKADEIIVFGKSKALGFGVVRVLGNNMSPDKMVTLAQTLKFADIDQDEINSLIKAFRGN